MCVCVCFNGLINMCFVSFDEFIVVMELMGLSFGFCNDWLTCLCELRKMVLFVRFLAFSLLLMFRGF